MLIKKPNDIKSSEITDERTYLSRRNFIRAGLLAGTTLATAGAYRFLNPPPKAVVTAEIQDIAKPSDFRTEEKLNSFEEITNYNNYYEFSTTKTSVARAAESFITRPWTIEVGGLVQKPQTFGIEDLLKFEQEERIYRLRRFRATVHRRRNARFFPFDSACRDFDERNDKASRRQKLGASS